MSLKEEAKGILRSRALAYKRVFLKKGTDTDAVLADLAKFCRASETTFHTDPRMTDILIGRREVFIRIAHHLQLTEDQLWSLYGNKQLPD